MVEIRRPVVTLNSGRVMYAVTISDSDGDRDLWFAAPAAFAGVFSDRAEPALLAVLLPAMAGGSDIRVHGPVSPQLVENLRGPFRDMIMQMLPGLQTVAIRADGLARYSEPGSGVATGFSLGVDSYAVVRDHHLVPSDRKARLTHLTYFNVGSHFHGGSEVFERRFPIAEQVASRIGLPIIPVDSNIDAFYPTLTYQQTMTMRNLAAAYVLQRGLGTYLVASGQFSGNQRVGPTESMPSADDFTLPLLSSETFAAAPGGGEYRRTDKIRRVAEIEESCKSLHVCNAVDGDPTRNCSWCQKCMRTMLTLDIVGVLERYGSVFDLEYYRRHRDGFIAAVYFRKGQYDKEVIALIDETGFQIPIGARALIRFRLLHLERLSRRVRNRIRVVRRG